MPIVIWLLAEPLLALMLWTVAAALAYAYRHTLGALLQGIARALDKGPHLGPIPLSGVLSALTGKLGSAVETIDNAMLNQLGGVAAKNQRPTARWIQGMGTLFTGLGLSLQRSFYNTLHALYVLRNATVPNLIGRTAHALQLRIHRVATVVQGIGADVIPRIHAREQGLADDLTWTKKRVAALGATAAAGLALPGSIALDNPLGRTIRGIRHRLSRLEKLLGAGLLTAGAAWVLSRVAPWLQCRNWKRVGRTVCQMPHNLLDDLLGLLIDFVALKSICQAIPWLSTVFSQVAEPFIEEISTAGLKLCSAPSQRAKPLHPPAPIAPTVYFTGTLILP